MDSGSVVWVQGRGSSRLGYVISGCPVGGVCLVGVFGVGVFRLRAAGLVVASPGWRRCRQVQAARSVFALSRQRYR